MSKTRCSWCVSDLSTAYHDEEWGVPVHDDRRFFEFIILEGAQAGLSWETILKKRENYRHAFADFDPARVARFTPRQVDSILGADPASSVVRHRGKVESGVVNAKAFLHVQREFGSFDEYVWRFVGGKPKRHRWASSSEVPAITDEARALSHDLRQRGFTFVGPTICYAFMQATGLVNDHLVDCFRHGPVSKLR